MAVIRTMTEEDLPQVTALEKENFSLPWDASGFRTWMVRDESEFLVAEDEGQVVLGYCGLLISFDESEVTNVCVAREARRQGLGRKLMEELVRRAVVRGVEFVHLDVRKSNTPARNMYEAMGFQTDGIRKGYYDEPKEDAVLMTWARS